MIARLRAAMVTVVLGSGTLEAAELVSKAKGFAVDFPVRAKETALPAPENAVAMTEWAGELLLRSFSVFVIDWGPPDPWADALLDLLRDDMSQEFGAVVEESYIHREGRPGRGLRLRGAKGLVHVRVFFDPPRAGRTRSSPWIRAGTRRKTYHGSSARSVSWSPSPPIFTARPRRA